jgi:hypothetical protein
VGDGTAPEIVDAREALDAVRRAVIEPEELPRRVVAAAVLANLDPAGPSVLALQDWGTQPASGPGAQELAALVAALLGPRDPVPLGRAVLERFGEAGVVSAVGVAALGVAEDLERPLPLTTGSVLAGYRPRLGQSLLGVSTQLTRSFGRIPLRWRRLSAVQSTVARWWVLHEATLAPGALTGEQKWLSMASLADALGDDSLSELYSRFLIGQGWSGDDVRGAMGGAHPRMLPGFARLLVGARQVVTGRLDLPRLALAGAGTSGGAAEEMVSIVRLVRALSIMRVLADPDGD